MLVSSPSQISGIWSVKLLSTFRIMALLLALWRRCCSFTWLTWGVSHGSWGMQWMSLGILPARRMRTFYSTFLPVLNSIFMLNWYLNYTMLLNNSNEIFYGSLFAWWVGRKEINDKTKENDRELLQRKDINCWAFIKLSYLGLYFLFQFKYF